MTGRPDPAETIQFVKGFHRDLLSYVPMLRAKEAVAEAKHRSARVIPPGPDPAVMEALRQTLLRGRGRVEPVYIRLVGRLVQPKPFNDGQADSVWQLALFEHPVYRQSHYAQLLADEISTLIGQLEHEPSLLDPPSPVPTRIAPSTLHITGDRNVINLSGRDGSIQHVSTGDRAELRETLDELIRAIQALDRSVEGRTAALATARYIASAVDGDGDAEEVVDGWELLGRFVNGVTALQIASSVPALFHQAAPLMAPLLHALGGG
jgi:hypothetical protein